MIRCAWCGIVYVGEPGKLWGTCCACRPVIEGAYAKPKEKKVKSDTIKPQA